MPRRTASPTPSPASGSGGGDRVLWWGDTSLEAVPVFGALAKLGAVFAPLNATRVDRRRYDRSPSTRGHGCCSPVRRTATPAAELADRVGHPVRRSAVRRSERTVGFGERAADPRCRRARPHVIFFTSGSTGRPKGVVLSHRANWLRTYPGRDDHHGRRRHRLHVPAVPHGRLDDRARCLAGAAGRCTSCACPTPRRCCATTARHRAARLYCIPAVWARSPRARPSARYDLSSLVEADTGTSATPPELLARDQGRAARTVTRVLLRLDRSRPGHATRRRRPAAQAGQRRRPASRASTCSSTDAGEVCVRSALPHGRLLRRRPRRPPTRSLDGWYHTGDLGALDDDGYLSIVGRARDVIRTGGETVAPPEVEQVLGAHPTSPRSRWSACPIRSGARS